MHVMRREQPIRPIFESFTLFLHELAQSVSAPCLSERSFCEAVEHVMGSKATSSAGHPLKEGWGLGHVNQTLGLQPLVLFLPGRPDAVNALQGRLPLNNTFLRTICTEANTEDTQS